MADESEEFTYEDHSQLPDILPIFPLPNGGADSQRKSTAVYF